MKLVKTTEDMAYYLYSNLSELYSNTDMEIYYLGKTVDNYNTKEIHPFYIDIDALADLVIHYSTIDVEKCKTYTHKLSEATREQLELSFLEPPVSSKSSRIST